MANKFPLMELGEPETESDIYSLLYEIKTNPLGLLKWKPHFHPITWAWATNQSHQSPVFHRA